MRHQKKTVRLGRTAEHRKALLANQVCSLIEHQRIKTTLGKNGSLHARRTALAVLRQKNAVKKLFTEVAPRSTSRNGGYTRIVKLGQRKSDSASMAFIEWVDALVVEEKPAAEEKEAKRKEPKPAAKQKDVEQQAKPEEKEVAPAPAEEPKPKKRKWFGKKSDDVAK